jgi:hypothetical protein
MAVCDRKHEHSWIYRGQSCCYRLECSIPGCRKQTTVHFLKGEMPISGEPVRILDDGDSMERIGTFVI